VQERDERRADLGRPARVSRRFQATAVACHVTTVTNGFFKSCRWSARISRKMVKMFSIGIERMRDLRSDAGEAFLGPPIGPSMAFRKLDRRAMVLRCRPAKRNGSKHMTSILVALYG
jgi:hypothetical protein